MLRSLLAVARAAPGTTRSTALRLPTVAATGTTPLLDAVRQSQSCFSTQPARKAFPSNLKIDPRSTFAPVNKNESSTAATASIRVEEDDDDEDDNNDEVAKKEGAAEQDEEDDDVYDDDEEDLDEDWVFEPIQTTPVIPLPERLHLPIYNFAAPNSSSSSSDNNDNTNSNAPEEVGTIWLNPSIFGKEEIRVDLMKRAVDYHRAKKRGRRTAHTKRIGDIRGSTRKMRPQKGQGTARAGHRFPGHWRGGAKAHGPTNKTDYGRTKLNKKVRRLAVQNVLSQKLKEGNLILVNQFHNLPSHKTKTLASWLQPFGIAGRHGTTALMIDAYWPSYEEQQQQKEKKNSGGDNDNTTTSTTPEATSYRGVPINLWVAQGNHFKLTVGNQLRNLNVYDALKHEKLVMTLDALTALEERLKD